MPALRRLLLLSALLIAAVGTSAARAAASPADTWMGLYMGAKKLGHSHVTYTEAEFRGQPAVKVVSDSVLQLEMFGNKVSQVIKSLTWTDRSWKPIYQEYDLSSNGTVTLLKAEYQPGKVVCTLTASGSASEKVVPVPAGVNLSVESPQMVPGKATEVGQKSTYHYLNPLTLGLDRVDIEVLSKGRVTLAGETLEAFKVSATTPLGAMISWQTPDGELLQGEMPMGIRMFREDAARAVDASTPPPAFAVVGGDAAGSEYKPPADFALATAVTTDRPIPNPRSVRALVLEVSGIDNPKLALSDGLQRSVPVAGQPNTYRIEVRSPAFTAARSARLPIAGAAVAPYLKAGPYLDIGNAELVNTARTVVGQERNAYRAAVKLRDWVHKVMRPDFTIGVPRPSTDVLKRRNGVCRDYATLMAGLARAAGIPTRVVGGIVYAEGRFFYHAWVECWVGQWVPFDPTQKGVVMDATHVKFAQGDVTDMYNVAGVIGRIKVKVVSVK